MTWLDYGVLAVLVLSVGWGIWRGLVREVMSLASFVIAFLAANLLAGPMAEHVPATVVRAEFRVLVAFVVVFIVALVLSSLTGLLLSKIVRAAGLGAVDRALGAAFGVARAVLLLLAFALVAGLTGLPRDSQWKTSVSGPLLARTALALKPWLPPALAERLRYD